MQKFDINLDPVTVVLNAVLEEESVSMDEVVVTYTIQRSSTLSQTLAQKCSGLSDGISMESIKKTLTETLPMHSKGLPALKMSDGRFAIIRGMNTSV
ncbi:MAG: hypothetical protein U0T81_17370 [Saprospiraceae bacterium]